MLETVRDVLAGEDAWVVGGAVRDELLGRELVDLDVALREPEAAARAYARRSGGAPFALSDRHGAWRVALDDGRTVDFTPLPGSIEDDLATRDFTINAIARPLAGGEPVDPFGGRADLEARSLRVVGELRRLSADGYRRLAELGLLEPLGGELDERLERWDSPDYRLVAVFRERLRRLPVSNELRRFAAALLRAEAPDDDARSLHRFRRATEPWALEALAFVGAPELAD